MGAGINPTLHTAGLAGLEAVINRALELAPRARAKLCELENHVFALECTSPLLNVYLQTGTRGVRLMGFYDGPVTTRVRGAASDFTELASSKDPAASLINGQLELEGDSAPLLELQKILGSVDVDWEAPLANALGDVAGHQLAQVLRASFAWGQQASTSFTRQLEEFIHEEARLSPPRLELEDFYRDVLELAQRTERLESRARRLRQKLNELKV
ncbi:MAG: ubiquinone biosynthesis protein UbiJ [Alcanivorax sp.]|jgi:ubiquinone biosynthesis protein UbiJ